MIKVSPDFAHQVAVAHRMKHGKVDVRCYSIKELKEPEIIYDWKVCKIKKRSPSAAGAIVGGIYAGLPGAIGGALLASVKSSKEEKSLISLAVKLISIENSSSEINVPIFLAMLG